MTHTHARRRQRPPRARCVDKDVVAIAQNLDNASTLENKSSAWIEPTGLDGLQARMIDLAAKAATSDDTACSMDVVTNDHVYSGPGHHWTNVHVRIGAKDEAAGWKSMTSTRCLSRLLGARDFGRRGWITL